MKDQELRSMKDELLIETTELLGVSELASLLTVSRLNHSFCLHRFPFLWLRHCYGITVN